MAQVKFGFHSAAVPPATNDVVFSRGDSPAIATVDPLGEAVAAGEPRYDGVVMIPSIATPEVVFSGSDTRGIVLASGVGEDVSTELMLWYRQPSSTAWSLYIFSGSFPTSLPSSPTRTLTLRTRTLPYGSGGTTGNGNSFYDLFEDSEHGTAIPSLEERWLAFEPMDACIFHGAIVLAGQVYLESAQGSEVFEIRGWGFAISNDGGDTWTYIGGDVISTDEGETDMAGWPRGSQFCLRAAPIHATRGNDSPTEVWFSSTDYRQNITSSDAPPRSARVFAFKLVRTDDTWQVEPGLTNAPVVFWTITDSITHTHAAQITEFIDEADPVDGLQLIASIGDEQSKNRYWRAVLADISDDYTVLSNWDTADEFHGLHYRPAVSEPPGDDPGTWSGQPASVCFGPPGQIIWGADTTPDVLIQMNAPMTLTGQASFGHLYGMPHCRGNADGGWISPILGTIRDPRPELAGEVGSPAVAILLDETLIGPGQGLLRPHFIRLLYTPRIGPYSMELSEDSTTWMQAMAVRSGGTYSVIFDGHIYVSSVDSSFGFKRIPVPETRVFRPMLVGPGGKNLAVEECAYSGTFYQGGVSVDSSVVVRRLTYNPTTGEYTDPISSAVYELPKAPCYPAAVFRIITSRFAAAPSGRPSTIGNFKISANAAIDEMDWATDPQTGVFPVRRWRGWVLDGTKGNLSPNKTSFVQLSQLEGTGSYVYAGAYYSSSDRWCPVHAIARRSIVDTAPNPNPLLPFPIDAIGRTPGTGADDNTMFLIVDMALDGNGAIGYPLVPSDTTNPPTYADELLTQENLSLTCNPETGGGWRMRVVGMHPVGSWDHFSERRDSQGNSDKNWPLFHLWADSDNWIELRADCENKRYELRISDDGTVTSHPFGDDGGLEQYWIADAPLMVALGYDNEAGEVLIGVSLGGDQVREEKVVAFSMSVTLTQLRFRSAETGEVVEYRWIGGDYDESTPASSAWMESAFESLEFLDPPE